MEIHVSAPRKGDVRDAVKRLTFKADDGREDEMQFLAAVSSLYRSGGFITLRKYGEKKPFFGWQVGKR
ncbi:hypothetical protein LCGC14_1239300 [marine sediment metagenome]|uniref:Uncharacterized protein n=1 Tax=marine sediment metagenome TaxID=412755 RepID=A0A0F9L6H8_9ZZZZ